MEQEAREREREKEARAAQTQSLTGIAPPATSSNTAENSKLN